MDLHLKNKKVFISGSSRGIGLEIGKQFLNHGSVVCFNSRRKINLNNLVDQKKINDFHFLKYDLSKKNNAKKCINEAYKKMKGLDILICNLGDGRKQKIQGKETYEDWLASLNLNLLSATNLIFHSKKFLNRSKNASILCISSICSFISSGAPLDYSSSKAALNIYVRNQSKILAENNIRINSISPGNIYSKDGRWPAKFAKDNKLKGKLLKQIPLKRFGSTKDIANAALFLSSECSSYTTGINFVVDGGLTA